LRNIFLATKEELFFLFPIRIIEKYRFNQYDDYDISISYCYILVHLYDRTDTYLHLYVYKYIYIQFRFTFMGKHRQISAICKYAICVHTD
jgi:hypothetical protein